MDMAGLNTSDVYSVSDIFPIYDFDQNSVICYSLYVLDDNSIVGQMDFVEIDGKIRSTFSLIDDTAVDNTIQFGDRFCIGFSGGTKWLCTDNGSCIAMNSDEDTTNISAKVAINYSANYSSLSPDSTVTRETIAATTAETLSTNLSKVLNVTHVANSKKDDGDGLCWAATVAMKVNFLRNTLYTAQSMYNIAVNNNIGNTGSVASVTGLYDFFHIDVTGVDIEDGDEMIDAQTLWNVINSGKPVDIAIRGTYQNETENSAYHQVLIDGMRTYSQGIAYRMDCPNASTANPKKFIYVEGDPSDLLSEPITNIEYIDTWTNTNTSIHYMNLCRVYY